MNHKEHIGCVCESIPKDQFVSSPAYSGGLRGTKTKETMVGKICILRKRMWNVCIMCSKTVELMVYDKDTTMELM